MSSDQNELVGLVDADLLDNGTRHPNLVLLKIAGFLKDNEIRYKLILNSDEDITDYTRIYLSRVFSFTNLPNFYEKAKGTEDEAKFTVGGTGFYATETSISKYRLARHDDMTRLERDEFLNQFPNKRGGERIMGIDMARQMPDYHLYDAYVNQQMALGFKREKYKDYQQYSIGFLTRGCIRHCSFCINKLESTINVYSPLECFLDKERDENNKLVRPYIYLWDDNFLASEPEVWRSLLKQLIATKRPFQFRQGLDERMLAQSPYGEEIAQLLAKSKYHGDFIFAFDNWRDRELIERALKIWKRYNPKKGTKFYLFCGFKLTIDSHEKFYQDIWEIFHRIKLLMQYGCVGYLMRHEDYHKYEISNLYIQIARWCNQQQFYKKMSFWEFSYRNQSYWEQSKGILNGRPLLMTFEEFQQDIRDGYYSKEGVKMCLPLKTILRTLEKFPNRREELIEMFNYKMQDLVNPKLWEDNNE